MKSFTRFLLLTVILLTSFLGAKAQVSLYTFSGSSGTYNPISGGLLLGNSSTDDQRFVNPAAPLGSTSALTGVGIPIGFSFLYNGTSYDRIAVNANGWISFGASSLTPSVNISSSSSYYPTSATSTANPSHLRSRVCGFATDLQGSSTSSLRVETIGSAPNRVCVIQWSNFRKFGVSGDSFNFQIRLNESSNLIQVVYGNMTNTSYSTTSEVGLGGSLNSDFNNRTTSTNWAATSSGTSNAANMAISNTVFPTSGQTYSWALLPLPTITFSSITPSVISCATTDPRQVVVDASIASGSISSVVLNYSFNGVVQTPITMTNSSGTAYSATIPAATPANANVTWNVSAISSITLANIPFASTGSYTGTAYQDQPLLGVTATAIASQSTICAGATSNLSMVAPNSPATITTSSASYMTGTYSGVFYHYFGGNKTQHLYSASELQAAGLVAGNINSLSMFLNVFGASYNDFAVSIAPTTQTTLTAFNNTANFSSVYSSASYTTLNGENNFVFSSPFVWDGVSNIIVQFCWSNNNGGGTSNVSLVHNPGYSCTAYYRADYQTAAQICGSTTASFSNSTRPSLKFFGVAGISASSYSWYEVGNTTPVATTNPGTVTVPATTDFYGVATITGCDLTSSNIIVNTLDLPATPTATGSTQCGTGIPAATVASAAVNDGTGMFYWYDAATNGVLVQGPPQTPIPATSCSYTFNLVDAVGDGWDGATMQILDGATVVATIGSTFTSGASATQTVTLTSGTTYTLFWNNAGSYSSEVGITVVDPSGTSVYTMAPAWGNPNTNTTLYSIVVDCPPSGFTTGVGSTTYNSALSSGVTYYVAELGTNGCYSQLAPVVIGVSQPAPITYANSVSAICIGESVTIDMSSTIVPPYTYTVASPNASAGVGSTATGATQTFTPTASGSMPYIVTATNGNCTEIDTVNITVVPSASPAPIIAMDTITICPSATSAAFTATASSINVSYTFNLIDSWGDGWNGNSLKVLYNGVLAETLTITAGTNFSTTLSIPEGTAITTEWTEGSFLYECSFNIVVGGATVHSEVMTTAANIASQMYSGTVPSYNYTFNWYSAATGGTLLGTGATFETIGTSVIPNINTAGQYTVYAVQSNACLSAATPAIVNVSNVLADIVPIDASCNSVANGSFALGTVSCGASPFTYSVDGGAFGAIPTDLAYGNHTVVVKDATGDVAPELTIFIDQPTWITNVPDLVANGWACKDETSEVISAANPLLQPTETLLIQSNISVPDADFSTFTPGNFTTTFNLNLPAGATVTSASLLINGLTTTGLTYASDLDITVSGIGSLSVTPSVFSMVNNLNLSYPLTSINSSSNLVTVSIDHFWDGSATISNLSLLVTYTITQTLDNITWYAAPVGGQTLDSGFSLESVGTTVLPNTTAPGVYNFYAQGELDGCSSFTRLLVPVTIQAPTIVANMQTATVCPGDFLTLNGSGGLTYTWNNAVVNDMPFVPAPTSYVSATQTYVVNGFDIDGCANQDTVVVTVLPQPILIAGVDQTVCEGTPIILNASTTTASPTPVTSFVWNNNILNNAQYVPTVSGPITVTANGANGCTTQDSVQISVLALPIVNAGVDQTICVGTGATLSASGAVSYVWNNNVSQGVTFYPTASQIYTVTGIGANGCTNLDQIQVNVATGPSVTVSAAQTVCANDAATFSAVSQNSLGGFWATSGNGTITPSISSAAITYLPAANDPAVVTLSYVATNACGNTADSTIVNVLPIPVINAGSDQAICDGSTVVLNATGTGFITWSIPNVSNGIAFVPVTTATYTATATALNNCTNQDQVTVTVLALPDVYAGDNLSICSGEQVTLNASGATAYQWSGGIANGTPFAPATTTTYSVTGTTVNGCASTDQVTVTVNPTPNAVASIVDDITLTATPGNFNYQWINCATGTAVPNASFATFNALANGTYAVIVSTPQGCSDQSDCITIDAVSVEQITEIVMSVQPNPTSGELSISMPTDLTAKAQVFDAQGKLVIDLNNVSNGSILNLTNMTTGVYMVRITSADALQTFRVVKQ